MADEPDNANDRCQQCGTPFPPLARPGNPKRFCSERCGRTFRMANTVSSQCKECGLAFPSRTGRTESGTKEYCSRQCANARRKVYESEYHRLKAAKQRNLRRKGVRPISVVMEQAEQRKQEMKAERASALEAHQCQGCQASLNSFYQRLCPVCSSVRAKAQKRAARCARKALQRSVTVERFDPIVVLRRDGWKCHICGRKTPERYRGTYRDDAPELDHIVPLAKGGEHSKANTACACRACNIAKSDRILGQPNLFPIAA